MWYSLFTTALPPLPPCVCRSGKKFGELAEIFPDAIPIGTVSAAGEVILNPPNASEVETGMGIVVLAEDDDSYQPTIAAKIAEGYLPPKEVRARMRRSCVARALLRAPSFDEYTHIRTSMLTHSFSPRFWGSLRVAGGVLRGLLLLALWLVR